MMVHKYPRVWFYHPTWYWFGWQTLTPIYYGHDDYARRTIMLGWTITGRIVIATNDCGDTECHYWLDRYERDSADD